MNNTASKANIFQLNRSFGDMRGFVSRYFLYGSATPGAIDIYRGPDFSREPIGIAHFSYGGGWRFDWYVVRDGMGHAIEEFRIRFAQHMLPYVEAARPATV